MLVLKDESSEESSQEIYNCLKEEVLWELIMRLRGRFKIVVCFV